jgi:hypothetical protein
VNDASTIGIHLRHMEIARCLVREIRETETRPSFVIRSLAKSVGLDQDTASIHRRAATVR